MDERASLQLIEALTGAWKKIREKHPEVPGVVILTAPAGRGKQAYGHFAALRWMVKAEAGRELHEVAVTAEHLNRPPGEIFETLLHEAAHAMNFERRIKDCSASQYHNLHFRDAAITLGLECQKVIHYGYAFTTLPEKTAAEYKAEIEAIGAVLIHRRDDRGGRDPGGASENGDEDEEGEEEPRSRSRKATCRCGYIIRVSKKTIESTVIRCESCGKPFKLV